MADRRESVRLRTYRVLATWSDLPVSRVPPQTKRIAQLWQENAGNPQVNEGVLSDLLTRLRKEFPVAGLALRPGDLTRPEGVDTVAKLVAHVEMRVGAHA